MSEQQSDLHDLGGDIGAASIRGSSSPEGARIPENDAAPQTGYAESVSDETAGLSLHGDSPVAGSDPSGDISPPPVPGAPSEYLSVDDADNLGRGADGETAARLEQKEERGL